MILDTEGPTRIGKRKRPVDESGDGEEAAILRELREERAKATVLRTELERQRAWFDKELRTERERSTKNEDRLWRMIEDLKADMSKRAAGST